MHDQDLVRVGAVCAHYDGGGPTNRANYCLTGWLSDLYAGCLTVAGATAGQKHRHERVRCCSAGK